MIRFLRGIPALKLSLSRRILVVGDLHLGLEMELGLRFNPDPCWNQLLELIPEFDQLVILGDLKHQIAGIPNLLSKLKQLLSKLEIPTHFIPGNHDGSLTKIMDQLGIQCHPPSGGVIQGVGFFHGHAHPSAQVLKSRYLIMAHTHPCIQFSREWNPVKCWIEMKLPSSKLIVIPAFGRYVMGIPLNKSPRLLGPFGSKLDLSGAQIYTLDGILLGSMDQLKSLPQFQLKKI